MTARRYWAEIDGERIYRASLAAIKRIAQDTADKLGRVVRVGYEDRPPARRNPTPPIKRVPGRVVGFAFVDPHRGKVISRTMRPALRAEDRAYAAEKGLSIRPLYEGDFYRNPAKARAKPRSPEAVAEFVDAVKENIEDAGAEFTQQARAYARQAAQESGASVTRVSNRILNHLRQDALDHSRRLASRYRPNPAKPAKRRQRVGGASPKLAYFAGVMAARDGRARASNPHYGAEAKAWREGFDYVVKNYQANPLALDLPDYAQAKDRARRGRLDFLAATKARRLAASLRKRQPRTVRREAAAAKTGRFAVHVAGASINGVRQPPMTLFRASRASADALGAGFEAAGYKVTIAPV